MAWNLLEMNLGPKEERSMIISIIILIIRLTIDLRYLKTKVRINKLCIISQKMKFLRK